MLSVVIASLMASCSKDDPFGNDYDKRTGRLLTSALDVSLQNEYAPRSLRPHQARAKAPSVLDFTVAFFLDGKEEPVATYSYRELPEIITLPVGSYTAKAFYGDNASAKWENPYYEGSTTFQIKEDQITDKVDPIRCSLSNVRVSIFFDQALKDVMDADCKVTVKVGESGSLDFTLDDEGSRSGYFAYVEDSHTLAAVFSGTVDGGYSTETKHYNNVKPGNHYQITFKLHSASDEDPGAIVPPSQGGLVDIDAEVSDTDMNADVDPGETVIPDTDRPKEEDPTPENPGKDDPIPDVPGKAAPAINVKAPYAMNVEQDLQDDPIVITVHSDAPAGIKTFKVRIDSEKLTPQELEGVHLNQNLDLVNPGQYAEGLTTLGFPIEGDVVGQHDIELTISAEFVGLLRILGESYHHFILTVGDDNGTTVSTLKINVKE